jgi:hypothetical protein
MEGDLIIAAGGFFVVLMGGLIAVAGVHRAWQPVQDNSPAPVLGTVIVVAGLAIVAFGVLLAVANIFIWLGARRRRNSE